MGSNPRNEARQRDLGGRKSGKLRGKGAWSQKEKARKGERELTLYLKGVLEMTSAAGLWLWCSEKLEGIPNTSYSL